MNITSRRNAAISRGWAYIRELFEIAISSPFLDRRANGSSSPSYNSNSIKSREPLPERITLLR